MLLGMEAAQIHQLTACRAHEKALRGGFRVCRANLHVRQRPFRMDNGRRVLLEVWRAGAPFLAGTVDSGRICSQTRVHLYPDLQAILRLQAVVLRLGGLSAH